MSFCWRVETGPAIETNSCNSATSALLKWRYPVPILLRSGEQADTDVIVRAGEADDADLLAGRIAWRRKEDADRVGGPTAWPADRRQAAAEYRSIAEKRRGASVARAVDVDLGVAASIGEAPRVLIGAGHRIAVDDGQHRSVVRRGRALRVERAELVDRRDDAVGTDVELGEVEAAQWKLAAQELLEQRGFVRRRLRLRLRLRLGLRRGVGLDGLVGVAERRHDRVVGIAIARAWAGAKIVRHARRHDPRRLAGIDAGQAGGLGDLIGIASTPAAAAASALGAAAAAFEGSELRVEGALGQDRRQARRAAK